MRQLLGYVWIVLMLGTVGLVQPTVSQEKPASVWTCHNPKQETIEFPSTPPADCPFPPSDLIRKVRFTGRYANYSRADTWYPFWADDGRLYSCWADGIVTEGSKYAHAGAVGKSMTGSAIIDGNDPLALTVLDCGATPASSLPFGGRYPCASLVHQGVWYVGTYALDQADKNLQRDFGWYTMGPFLGFRTSSDGGKKWTASKHDGSKPFFPEPTFSQLDRSKGERGPYVRLGAPHVVDHGKGNRYAPDGCIYMVGHGAEPDDPQPRLANVSWNSGDGVYLTRVKPSPQTITDPGAWEFFAGLEGGHAIWTKDFARQKPLLQWNNRMGIVTATWVPGLERYILCITNGHRGTTSRGNYDTYLLEAPSLAGPWKMVTYWKDFGPQAYFVCIPSKFISADGRKFWLAYSANYMAAKGRNYASWVQNHTNPHGSAYSLSLHEVVME